MMPFEVRLPLPPSANNLFATSKRGGRYRTTRYRVWIIAAGWELLFQNPRPVCGRYAITITLPRMRANADPDNRIKAISDLLVTHRLIEDDSVKYCARLDLETGAAGEDVTVRVTEAED